MKKMAFLCAFMLMAVSAPVTVPEKVVVALGTWTQANGSPIPNYDEFNRTDDTNGTVCATTNSGKPYICWSENKFGDYKICVSTSDGENWLPPSGDTTFSNFEVINVAGKCTNPSMIVIDYDDGTTAQDIPIIFFDRNDGTHYKSCCAYLKDGTWFTKDFTRTSNQEARPFVTIGDDDRIYATWCQGYYGYDSLPVIIAAEMDFPLVWKHIDGSPAINSANPIFSSPEYFYHSRVAIFDGKPILCAEYKETMYSDFDIAIAKWDGANWTGLTTPDFTIIGDSTYSDNSPRIAVSASGSPILCWVTDYNGAKKTFFTYWTGLGWAYPGGTSGYQNISDSLLSGESTFNADMIMGQYNICHLAFNIRNNNVIYLQTDLEEWFTVDKQPGITLLPYGISNPSLASWMSNYPMIAGDRLLPADNPAFTMYWVNQSFFVEWGIEISQPPHTILRFDDDGKTIPAIDSLTYKLRAMINIPQSYQASNIIATYNVPTDGKFIPNPSLNSLLFLDKWVWLRNGKNWIQLSVFPPLNSPLWDEVTKVRLLINPIVFKPIIRFDIGFKGSAQKGKWMKNLLDVSLTASTNTISSSFNSSTHLQDTTQYFSSTNIVSNPVGQYMPPTFYLNVDPNSGTISTDGGKTAYFTVYIIPVGLFLDDVLLSMPQQGVYGLAPNFGNTQVPGRPGIRSTTLAIKGTKKTPRGPLDVKIQGDKVDSSSYGGINLHSTASISESDASAYTNVRLDVERAQLLLSKKADRVNVQPNSVITYTITIRNVGGATAYSVFLKDILPEDVDYLSSFPTSAVSGKTASWDVGDIPQNKSVIYTIKVRVKDIFFSSGSTISNVATAEYDGWLTSSATVFVTVRPAETPCPAPQAEIRFETDGKDPQAGIEIKGKLRIWDGCSPYKFQLFWGDDTDEDFGHLDQEGYYSLPPHTYATSGTYFLVCYITDKYGKQNVIRKQMVVH